MTEPLMVEWRLSPIVKKLVSNGYNGGVWQKFHILSRAQVFIVAALCAFVIALAVGLASIPADGISWYRFLGPSRQFDPFMNFGSTFVSVFPILLGYYHLARIGALVGLAVSLAMYWATQVCALFVFAFQLVGRAVVLQEATYVMILLLLTIAILWVHVKASNSRTILDAQRSLHLTPQAHMP